MIQLLEITFIGEMLVYFITGKFLLEPIGNIANADQGKRIITGLELESKLLTIGWAHEYFDLSGASGVEDIP